MTQPSAQADANRQANREDIRKVVGDVEDAVVVEILSHGPSFRDLSDAAIWSRGNGDLVAREHKELSATALAVAEILTRMDEEETVDPVAGG